MDGWIEFPSIMASAAKRRKTSTSIDQMMLLFFFYDSTKLTHSAKGQKSLSLMMDGVQHCTTKKCFSTFYLPLSLEKNYPKEVSHPQVSLFWSRCHLENRLRPQFLLTVFQHVSSNHPYSECSESCHSSNTKEIGDTFLINNRGTRGVEHCCN